MFALSLWEQIGPDAPLSVTKVVAVVVTIALVLLLLWVGKIVLEVYQLDAKQQQHFADMHRRFAMSPTGGALIHRPEFCRGCGAYLYHSPSGNTGEELSRIEPKASKIDVRTSIAKRALVCKCGREFGRMPGFFESEWDELLVYEYARYKAQVDAKTSEQPTWLRPVDNWSNIEDWREKSKEMQEARQY